jgi:hypothetical protein
MKPEHFEWVPRICEELSAAAEEVLGGKGTLRSAR